MAGVIDIPIEIEIKEITCYDVYINGNHAGRYDKKPDAEYYAKKRAELEGGVKSETKSLDNYGSE